MPLRARFLGLSIVLLLCLPGCNRGRSTANTVESAPSPQPVAVAPSPSLTAEPTGPDAHIDGAKAMQYTKEIVALGPRWVGSQGQRKVAAYLQSKLKNDQLEEDSFIAETPAGKLPMTNWVAKFPGTRDGVIVLGSHIDTNYPLRNTNYIGANDGASTTALLLALADQLRGKKLDGFGVWLAFFDGEEAIQSWDTERDSTYGSKHLAEKWRQSGELKNVKALILADMIGDADLDIDRDRNSTPWLEDLVLNAATRLGYQSHFFARDNEISDDHLPFAKLGIPVADVIDIDYGYNDSYHHTTQDTLDKLSVKSLQISGDVILETIRLLDANADRLPKPPS